MPRPMSLTRLAPSEMLQPGCICCDVQPWREDQTKRPWINDLLRQETNEPYQPGNQGYPWGLDMQDKDCVLLPLHHNFTGLPFLLFDVMIERSCFTNACTCVSAWAHIFVWICIGTATVGCLVLPNAFVP